MPSSSILFTAQTIGKALSRIASQIVEQTEDPAELALVGIQQKGVLLAGVLQAELKRLDIGVQAGSLDVSMHRDDLSQNPTPEIQPTSIPFDINHKTVVLVDDVIFSGRTIRAALDALNDYGRPQCVRLAVLIDRGRRQLPIAPDFVGRVVSIGLDERVLVKPLESSDDIEVYLLKP